jgi:hypothetical protein
MCRLRLSSHILPSMKLHRTPNPTQFPRQEPRRALGRPALPDPTATRVREGCDHTGGGVGCGRVGRGGKSMMVLLCEYHYSSTTEFCGLRGRGVAFVGCALLAVPGRIILQHNRPVPPSARGVVALRAT